MLINKNNKNKNKTYRLLVKLHKARNNAIIFQSTCQVNDTCERKLSKNCGGKNDLMDI